MLQSFKFKFNLDTRYRACLYAELDIPNINAEVMTMGIICEEYGLQISFGCFGSFGAGCAVNFNVEKMKKKEKGIEEDVEKLSHRQLMNMRQYGPTFGKDNKRHPTDQHETESYKTFLSSAASRIVYTTARDGQLQFRS
ncbi:unnamed protein product [Didymodactylos carnosus]|uniref:Uncharacterized protein n=1 Tax=Didymodactylos carnosus TaxID=1234261 RepID=A0A814RAY8_9BILA|nr:unnamed protein product [Didymodactylos carnosus]CAF3893407.1 unnamed protein product [Didymodactylos carnosus]